MEQTWKYQWQNNAIFKAFWTQSWNVFLNCWSQEGCTQFSARSSYKGEGLSYGKKSLAGELNFQLEHFQNTWNPDIFKLHGAIFTRGSTKQRPYYNYILMFQLHESRMTYNCSSFTSVNPDYEKWLLIWQLAEREVPKNKTKLALLDIFLGMHECRTIRILTIHIEPGSLIHYNMLHDLKKSTSLLIYSWKYQLPQSGRKNATISSVRLTLLALHEIT